GTIAGSGFLGDAACPKMGWYDKRFADTARRLGQGARRACAEVYGGGDHRLRHGYLRRPDAVAEECERHRPLHGLDSGARTRGSAWMEWLPDICHAVLAVPTPLQNTAAL